MMKKTLLATACGMMLFAHSAFAAEHIGSINKFHLNPDFLGREACVTMSPSLPGTGYGCLWQDNPLHEHILDLLRDAFNSGKKVLIRWDTTDPSGHANIDLVEGRR